VFKKNQVTCGALTAFYPCSMLNCPGFVVTVFTPENSKSLFVLDWSNTMPKLIPESDELSKPFWDAVNGKRLMLQHCGSCDKLQYPPKAACHVCGSAEHLGWKDVEGKGHVATFIVIEDGRLNRRMPDQPYNLAMVTLDEDPSINFYSNLPGVAPYDVPVGSAVEVVFEDVGPGQLIHEWQVVS